MESSRWKWCLKTFRIQLYIKSFAMDGYSSSWFDVKWFLCVKKNRHFDNFRAFIYSRTTEFPSILTLLYIVKLRGWVTSSQLTFSPPIQQSLILALLTHFFKQITLNFEFPMAHSPHWKQNTCHWLSYLGKSTWLGCCLETGLDGWYFNACLHLI